MTAPRRKLKAGRGYIAVPARCRFITRFGFGKPIGRFTFLDPSNQNDEAIVVACFARHGDATWKCVCSKASDAIVAWFQLINSFEMVMLPNCVLNLQWYYLVADT